SIPTDELAVDVPAEEPIAEVEASPWPAANLEASVEPNVADAEFTVVEEPVAQEEAATAPTTEESATPADIDLSQWEDAVTVQADDAPAVPEIEVSDAVGEHEVPSNAVEEKIEEIRFYISQGMPEQASAALARLQTLTNDKATLTAIRSEVDAAIEAAAQAK